MVPLQAEYQHILTSEALSFFTKLQRLFNPVRLELLEAQKVRQQELDRGARPAFLPEATFVREEEWQMAPAPPDLQRGWVEITGPVDRKMMINALNAGSDVFMADFEDSLSPPGTTSCRGRST